MKIILEGVVIPKTEDGGQAQIAEIGDIVVGGDEGFFVRLQSWQQAKTNASGILAVDENMRLIPPDHPTMEALTGLKVRVTVEVIG